MDLEHWVTEVSEVFHYRIFFIDPWHIRPYLSVPLDAGALQWNEMAWVSMMVKMQCERL